MTPELTEIQTIVRLQLGLAKADPEDRLVGDLGAVSADIVNIVVALEQKYGVDVDESALAGIRTVADLHGLIARLL